MAHPLPPALVKLLSASRESTREAAWEGFLNSHNRLILHACRQNGAGHDGVMDRYAYVVEHLREDDFRRLRAFRETGSGKFSSWFLVVARRLCVDHHRQRFGRVDKPAAGEATMEQVARRRLAELLGEELDLAEIEDVGTLRPDERVQADELREALQQAISALSAEDQLLVTLRFKDGLSVRRIAKILGHSNPFRLYRRVDRILASLRELLEQAGITGSEP